MHSKIRKFIKFDGYWFKRKRPRWYTFKIREPLELQPSKNTARRKAREAYFRKKDRTLSPDGLNRRNEN